MEPAWSKVNPKVIKMNVLDAKWAPIGHQSVFVGVPTHDQDQKTNWSFDFDIRLAFIWQTISPFAFNTHVAPIWHEIYGRAVPERSKNTVQGFPNRYPGIPTDCAPFTKESESKQLKNNLLLFSRVVCLVGGRVSTDK